MSVSGGSGDEATLFTAAATASHPSIRRSLVLTAIGEFVALAGAGLALILLGRTLGPTEFASYALAYRVVGVISAPLLLGVTVSLPRLLPREGTAPGALVAAALGLVLSALAVCVLLALPFSARLTHLLLGEPPGALAAATLGLLAGGLINAVVLAYLRGSFDFVAANSLGAINFGLVPIISVLLFRDVVAILSATAACWVCLPVVFLLAKRPQGFGVGVFARMRLLFRVGWPRVPGEVALFGMLSTPPVLALHVAGVRAAGYVSLGVSAVTLAGSGVAPLSTALLPHTSRLLHLAMGSELRAVIRRTAVTVTGLAAMALLLAELLLHTAVRILLGPAFEDAVPVIRLVLLAMPAYVLFVALRGFVDGESELALTMRFACAGLLVAASVSLGLIWLDLSEDAPPVGLAAGLWTLALLTAGKALAIGDGLEGLDTPRA